MASISSESLAKLREALAEQASSLSLESAQEFFAILRALDENPALQRALTDPARSPEERQELFLKLFGSSLSQPVAELARQSVASRFSSLRDFTDAFEVLGVDAVALVAEREGEPGLAQLENELFAFQNAVGASHELQAALGSVDASDQARQALANRLSQKSGEPATVLIHQAISSPRGMKVAKLVERFAALVAARHNRWIAQVETSRPLTPEQSQRLAAGLNRLYGRELKINATTLPSLIGGVKVRVGEEVLDSSTMARLNHLKQRLVS